MSGWNKNQEKMKPRFKEKESYLHKMAKLVLK